MGLNILLYDRDEDLHTFERSPTNTLVGYPAEPSLHKIEPRTRCRRKVQMKTGMAFEPCLHVGMFVRAIVIDDKM